MYVLPQGEVFAVSNDEAGVGQLRERLERLSLQRARYFSWLDTARKTLDVYYAVAERGRARRAAAVEPARV